MNCRHCNTSLNHVFADLDYSPPSNSYLDHKIPREDEATFPLKVWVCENCFLVQVDEHKNASEIFDDNYAYFSSFSKSWLAHSKKYVDYMMKRFSFSKENLVVEIASNDGYLLQYFQDYNIPVLGVEPTKSTAQVAQEKGIETLTDFFGHKFATTLIKERKKASLILGNNVLAHVPDINDFVKGIHTLLNEDGVVTMEFPHLYQLIKNNQFDTIYHEHFSYLSLLTVKRIFNSQGLELFDVQELETHGGSLRIFAKHKTNTKLNIEPSINRLLEIERKVGTNSLEYYSSFQPVVDRLKGKVLDFLNSQKTNNKKVVAYGAAAKGNTLLNYCEVKHEQQLLDYVMDASPYKQGKLLPGSHIPIVSEEKLKETRPDFIIILPWNIKKEIINQLNYAKDWGAQFVIFIPDFQIL